MAALVGLLACGACSSTTSTPAATDGGGASSSSGGSCTIGPAPTGQCPTACVDFGKFSVKANGVYDHDFCTAKCDATTACPSNYTCNTSTSLCMPACITSADCPAFKSTPDCNMGSGFGGFCQ